jgi:hypothetical protein
MATEGRGVMVVEEHWYNSSWYKNFIPTIEWGAAKKYSFNHRIFRNWFPVLQFSIIILAVFKSWKVRGVCVRRAL